MFKSWSLFKKLVLANILYSIPVIALIWMMVGAQNVNIDFGVQEKMGNLAQRPMESLLQSLLRLRTEPLQSWSSVQEDALKNLETLKGAFDQVGANLQFDQVGLDKRNRGHIEISKFETRLKDFFEQKTSLDAAKRLETLNGLVSDVRTMITHAGDTSNLILDPDLDSYYLMDITLLALPQTQDRIAEIKQFVLSRGETLTQEEKVQVAVYSALLKQSDLDRILGDLQTTLNEDANFYGVSEGLKANLAPAIEAYSKEAQALISVLQKISETGVVQDRAVFAKVADAAFETSFKSWFVAVDELDQLLNKRIDQLNMQKFQSLALAILALLIAVAILFWISSSFNSNMKNVIGALKEAVTKAQSSSDNLTDLSDKLSSMSDEQASAVQQTSSAMHEIESMIQTTLSNVSTAKEKAEKSVISANGTRESVQSLSAAIEEISKTNEQVLLQMQQSQAEMSGITSMITEIGSKTKIINDIVFQTKLLSFNASVEAARAGEAGKGFSVVAEEVGNLAQMSGTASNEISNMLSTSIEKVNFIAEQTGSKVGNLIDDSRERMSSGARLVEECQSAIQEILQRIEEMMSNTSSIHLAAEEQSKGIEEVTKALVRLDEMARKNMEMSRETAQQSQIVVEQAKSLMAVSDMVQEAVMGK